MWLLLSVAWLHDLNKMYLSYQINTPVRNCLPSKYSVSRSLVPFTHCTLQSLTWIKVLENVSSNGKYHMSSPVSVLFNHVSDCTVRWATGLETLNDYAQHSLIALGLKNREVSQLHNNHVGKEIQLDLNIAWLVLSARATDVASKIPLPPAADPNTCKSRLGLLMWQATCASSFRVSTRVGCRVYVTLLTGPAGLVYCSSQHEGIANFVTAIEEHSYYCFPNVRAVAVT